VSRIVRIDVGRFDYRFRGEFKFFPPGKDGVVRRPSVLVRIVDEEGAVGWGQAVPIPAWTYETPETVESTLREYLAPALVGADPTDLAGIHERMNRAIRPAFSVGQPLCKAAIDLACFDLLGKRLGLPGYATLAVLAEGNVPEDSGGGQRAGQRAGVVSAAAGDRAPGAGGGIAGQPSSAPSITFSWTVNTTDLAVAERLLEEGRRLGYRNFNIKVGPPQTPEYDVRLAKLVREFEPDGFLWCDANVGYTLETAVEVSSKLADVGADVLESPLPPNRISDYQALKRYGALPIVMDEGLLSPVEAEEFARLGMCDGFALKPARNAGLWPSKGIVEVARKYGLMVLGSGLTDPDLSLAAAVHLYAWAGIDRPCALNGPQFLFDADGQGILRPSGGKLAAPRGPGLGIPIPEAFEKAVTQAA